MSGNDSARHAHLWLKTQLFLCCSSVADPQLSEATCYNKDDEWISYGAFLYALAALERADDIYPIDLERLERAHYWLKAKMARPDTDFCAWGREGGACGSQHTELPWQVWEDATFDEMESKASLPNQDWLWFDIKFRIQDLTGFLPVPNVYLLGREYQLSGDSRDDLEFTEAVTALGIGRAIESIELRGADYTPVAGYTYPPAVDSALHELWIAARNEELPVWGTPSHGLDRNGDPILIGANRELPVTAFGPDCRVSLEMNTINFGGGPTRLENEYTRLRIRPADLYHFAQKLESKFGAAELAQSRDKRSLEKRVFRAAQDIVLNHPKQWSLRYEDIFALVDLGEEKLTNNGYQRVQEKLGERFPGLTKSGPKPKSEPKDWQTWV